MPLKILHSLQWLCTWVRRKKKFGGVTVPSEIRFTGRLLVALLGLVFLAIAAMIPFVMCVVLFEGIDSDRAFAYYFLGFSPWLVLLIAVFFIWTYKSAKNKYYITGEPLTYTGFIGPKMSVAFFFIPVLNFFMPYFVIREIWVASNLDNPKRNRFFPAIILIGWMLYLSLIAIDRIAAYVDFDSLIICAAACGLFVATYLFLIYIFLTLTNDQIRAISQKRGLPFKKLKFPFLWLLVGFVLMMASTYWFVSSRGNFEKQMLKEAYELYGGENKNLDEAFKAFKVLAEKGNGEGLCRLGECYEYGFGTEIDEKKAFYCYLKGAQLGDAEAQNELAYLYYEGIGTEPDLQEAIKWLKKSAEQEEGNGTAHYNLGYVYAHARDAFDFEEARKCYLKAIELGEPKAKFELYKLMLEDDPASENSKEAVEWLKKAAEDNHVEALNVLGVLCYEGDYVEEDEAKAVELLSRAAKTGYPAAKYNLGYIYFYDENLKDDAKAYEYLKAAADGEYESAYILLSRFYAEGIVAEKDVAKAVELLEKAGDNPDAYFRLGIVYEAEGDAAKSKEYLKKAADMGHEKAAEKLRDPDKELGQ